SGKILRKVVEPMAWVGLLPANLNVHRFCREARSRQDLTDEQDSEGRSGIVCPVAIRLWSHLVDDPLLLTSQMIHKRPREARAAHPAPEYVGEHFLTPRPPGGSPGLASVRLRLHRVFERASNTGVAL